MRGSQTSSSPWSFFVRCFFFIWILGSERFGFVAARDRKHKLVVFAGPRKTSETSVEEFFKSYAIGPSNPLVVEEKHQALKGWVWPKVHDSVLDALEAKGHSVYANLVTKADDAIIQEVLLNAIRESYNENKDNPDFEGIILGNEEFDRVEPSPYSSYDALDAVFRVADTLGFEKDQVTIILLYRLPRLDQWLSIFNFVPMEIAPGSDNNPYEEFLCTEAYEQTAFEALEQAMNPFQIAQKYQDHNFQVKVVDLEAIRDDGYDVEHWIGCEYLGADCDKDGYLINLREKSFLKNSEKRDSMGDIDAFDYLTFQEKDVLEELFQVRDCSHHGIGNKNRVNLDYQKNMLAGCTSIHQVSQKMKDPAFMLNLLQTQVGCNTYPASIEEFLRPIEEKEARIADSKGSGWLTPVFFLVFVVAGVVALVWVRRSDRRIQLRFPGASQRPARETAPMVPNKEVNLSPLT